MNSWKQPPGPDPKRPRSQDSVEQASKRARSTKTGGNEPSSGDGGPKWMLGVDLDNPSVRVLSYCDRVRRADDRGQHCSRTACERLGTSLGAELADAGRAS